MNTGSLKKIQAGTTGHVHYHHKCKGMAKRTRDEDWDEHEYFITKI